MILLYAILFPLLVSQTYYSEDRCTLYSDLEMYSSLLQDDVVVETFLQKYSEVTSYVESVDESVPPKASIIYESGIDDEQKILEVYVRETGPTPNQCFVPVRYTYQYYELDTIQTITYFNSEQQKLIDLLTMQDVVSPYQQLRMGILPENVMCKVPLELHVKDETKPLCLKPETYEKLVQRGYFKNTY